MISIEKSMLTTILKKDILGLGEINIWDCVIQWGIGQNKELEKDISEWNKEDYKILKDILEDIIPLIRFNEINSKDFFRKITPFKRIFIEELYNEIIDCYLDDELQQRLLPQKGL